MFSIVTSGKKISRGLFSALLVLVLALTVLYSVKGAAGEENSLPDGGTPKERQKFIASLGYEADESVLEEKQNILIPSQFSKIYNDYNNLQKSVGYDLLPFAGREAVQYTLKLKDKSRNDVYAHLIVFNEKIIGGDISALSVEDGYMLPIG